MYELKLIAFLVAVNNGYLLHNVLWLQTSNFIVDDTELIVMDGTG